MKTLIVVICGIIALFLLNTGNPYWKVFMIPVDLALFHIYFTQFKECLNKRTN